MSKPTAERDAPVVGSGCCCQTARAAPPKNNDQGAYSVLTSFLLSFGIAFFPKCPLCWMAYMSLFSALGFEAIPYQPWMLPVMLVLLLVNITLLWYLARKDRNTHRPVLLSLAGVALILLSKFYFQVDWLIYCGLAVMLLATLWNAAPQLFRRRWVFRRSSTS